MIVCGGCRQELRFEEGVGWVHKDGTRVCVRDAGGEIVRGERPVRPVHQPTPAEDARALADSDLCTS